MRRVQPWPIALFGTGLVLLFIGERILADDAAIRWIIDALGAAALVAGFAGRLRERAAAPDDLRRVLTTVVAFMAVAVAGAAASWLASGAVTGGLGLDDEGAARFRGVVNALWPIVVACGVLPLLFMEVSLQGVAAAPVVETRRVHRSGEAGLLVALALSLLFALNYLASEHNWREDLSYAKTTRPSAATALLVESFSEPVRVVLFFPAANEVEEEVLPYFETLAQHNDLITVERVDHDAEPALARELKARKNGTVVLVRGDKTESYSLGTDIDKAKKKLKKLDEEMHKRLLKVAKPQLVAYVTTGHGERTWDRGDEEDARARIKDLRSLLQLFNYKIETLGLADGLASEMPDDASVVIVPGPTTELLDEEAATLRDYLARGGSVLVFLDPEQEVRLDNLLGPLGVTFVPQVLAHDTNYIPRTHKISDRTLLFSDRFTTHAAVKALQKNSSRFPIVMSQVGYFETGKGESGDTPEVVLKSLAKTWADLDGDLQFGGEGETRKTFDIAVAAEVPGPPPEGEGAEPTPGRLLAFADCDLASDLALRNDGNTNLLADSLKWLVGEEDLVGEMTTEEDVRIQHTRKEDVWWFYSTTFGIPLCILGAGLLVSVRRRRTSR